MLKTVTGIALLGIVAAGCIDNDTSFFVEHAKMQPDAPECTVAKGDGFAATGVLDLFFRNPYTSFYLVHNELMVKEDYGNLKSEVNGIIVDGMEVHVRGLDGVLWGENIYYEFENFVEPEDTQVLAAISVNSAVVDRLAGDLGCPRVDRDPPVPPSFAPIYYGMVYSEVRFLGHTNGGLDVETPWFTFPIELCCGCLVEWANCSENAEYETYCIEPEAHGMCVPGVGNGGALFDCRTLYFGRNASICEEVDS
jgi:hypothetical protein